MDLYKTLYDYSMNNPESILEFEMDNGEIFEVKFSHLDINLDTYIDEYKDSLGLIYKICKVRRRIKYDYSNIFIEITREYLPVNIKILSDNFIQ